MMHTQPDRPPYAAATVAAAAVLALYILTLAPSVQFWDAGEYIAAAHVLGIPHPPGNPTFVLLARTWELLLEPTGLSAAVRINLFSAVMSACAHGCWFLVVHRILASFSPLPAVRLIGAAIAVTLSATAFSVWSQSNVNEKVYTVALLTIALLSWLALRWRDWQAHGGHDRLLLLLAFVAALSAGNHLLGLLALPGVALFVLFVNSRVLKQGRLIVTGALLVAGGLSIQLFLPIRAAQSPVINQADPACASIPSAALSIATLGVTGCDNLSAALRREQYDKPSVFADPNERTERRSARMLLAQIVNYFQYFDWQWARSLDGPSPWFTPLRVPFTGIFLALGLVGALAHFQRDRQSWVLVATLFATLSAGLVLYLNFRFGHSVPEAFIRRELLDAAGDTRVLREVRERDYFFLAGFSVWALWAGIGLTALWQDIVGRVRARRSAVRYAELRAAPVLLIAALPLILNWSWATRAGDYTARDWAYNLLMSVAPYGVLFTVGDNDTFPLWYLQEVEGIRQDVTVLTRGYLTKPWYLEQIAALTAPCGEGVSARADRTRLICQRPFEAGQAPHLARAAGHADFYSSSSTPSSSIAPPTQAVVPLPIAGTPGTQIRAGDRVVYRIGDVEFSFDDDQLRSPLRTRIAGIIAHVFPERPVYFAATRRSLDIPELREHLVRDGLTLRLGQHSRRADGARERIPNSALAEWLGQHIDLEHTTWLADSIFIHRGGFPTEWRSWRDHTTSGIPFYYGNMHYSMETAYAAIGRTAAAAREAARRQAFYELVNVRP